MDFISGPNRERGKLHRLSLLVRRGEVRATRFRWDCDLASLNPNEGYSIPQGDGAQDRIDGYVENSGDLFSNFVRDTNNDGIWDTGVVIMGISFDMTNTDITPRADLKTGEEIRDHKAFIAYVKALFPQIQLESTALFASKSMMKSGQWTRIGRTRFLKGEQSPLPGSRLSCMTFRTRYTRHSGTLCSQ